MYDRTYQDETRLWKTRIAHIHEGNIKLYVSWHMEVVNMKGANA